MDILFKSRDAKISERSRRRGVNHCDCSQTAGFLRDVLRLGSDHSSLERRNTLESALTEPSPCQVDGGEGRGGYHDMRNDYSLAPITPAPVWLSHCGNQANHWWCVCVRKGALSTRAGLLRSANVCWNESCVSSGARQQTQPLPAACRAARLHPTRRLPPWLLSDARHSAPCFHNSSGTDGWHSCSAGPHGLLKKAINQSRHSIQAGNWPIRVAQDAYVQADDFTNWLSIYTNTQALHKKDSLAAVSAFMFYIVLFLWH